MCHLINTFLDISCTLYPLSVGPLRLKPYCYWNKKDKIIVGLLLKVKGRDYVMIEIVELKVTSVLYLEGHEGK